MEFMEREKEESSRAAELGSDSPDWLHSDSDSERRTSLDWKINQDQEAHL